MTCLSELNTFQALISMHAFIDLSTHEYISCTCKSHYTFRDLHIFTVYKSDGAQMDFGHCTLSQKLSTHSEILLHIYKTDYAHTD